jgi:hypothetical protein
MTPVRRYQVVTHNFAKETSVHKYTLELRASMRNYAWRNKTALESRAQVETSIKNILPD